MFINEVDRSIALRNAINETVPPANRLEPEERQLHVAYQVIDCMDQQYQLYQEQSKLEIDLGFNNSKVIKLRQVGAVFSVNSVGRIFEAFEQQIPSGAEKSTLAHDTVSDFARAYKLLILESDGDGWLGEFLDIHPLFTQHIGRPAWLPQPVQK